MRTPAGKECSYFYGNYFRGRNEEECRLLRASGARWTRDLCRTCPAPGIQQANACQVMKLRGTVARPISSLLQRRVQVSAFCEKLGRPVDEPEIGCGECHPLPLGFTVHPDQ